MHIGLHVKYPMFLSILMKLEFFSKDFQKILRFQNPRKSYHLEANYSKRTDGRTDTHKHTTKLIVTYCSFARAAINVIQYTYVM